MHEGVTFVLVIVVTFLVGYCVLGPWLDKR